MNWQLNKIQYPIYNLGEGKRIGIWVQGCNLGCKGCVNQTLWNKNGGKSISVVDVFNWLSPMQNEYDGITISGGEPFQQYEQLISFLHLIKAKTNLNVQCFSGYYLSELKELFPDNLFSKYIDTLIDGRYIQEQHENTNLKGSTNQTAYNFIDAVPVKQEESKVSNKWSINVSKDNQIYMTGIPKENELKDLCNELLEVGIQKKFK
jgi:anaerobic ribonucleoside-triphosphate reductase activating protein